MRKILIATTNKEKFKEITTELADMHFKFVGLKDVGLDKIELDEPHTTTWQNALEKAEFFAKKSGLLTFAEDTGLFIKELNGQPGIKSKRYAPTAKERIKKVLTQLSGVPDEKRTAYFQTTGCLFDPQTGSFTTFSGRVDGQIAKTMQPGLKEDMGYDPIFYFPPLKKTFSQMSILEKNSISHRGQTINQLRYFLMTNYQVKQIMCAAGIVVKNGKMLMTKRRDHRPLYNNKWEFPGGGVEVGKSIAETLYDEVFEESGFKVNIEAQLPEIPTMVETSNNYQVHLVLYICSVKSGKIKLAEAESSDYGWFTYAEALKSDMMPLNKKLIQSKKSKEILLKYIQ